MNEDKQEPKNVVHGKLSASGGGTQTLSGFAHHIFAPKWFEDALMETRSPPSLDTKRREIVFATCCIETYLVEWTIQIIPRPHETVGEFFPEKDRFKRIGVRYDNVAERLKSKDLIPRLPIFDKAHRDELDRLFEFRNALVHGNVSWPIEPSMKVSPPMKVSPQELDEKGLGWAVGVVIKRIKCLHKANDTDPPAWLIEP
jgi:hypothetical protein